LTYDQSVRQYEKYYKIYASVESSNPVKVGKKMKIHLKIEVLFSSSDPGRYRTEILRKTTDELTIE
jgi:hypothetical protein